MVFAFILSKQFVNYDGLSFGSCTGNHIKTVHINNHPHGHDRKSHLCACDG